ncbi:flagellar hook protein FlgE [Photobacterium angustum]|uniref:flagellar hook protein FlgE n=1 Tax=Photobacterium angustum TaxID=661 RepID=UPI0005E20DF1|nr:flagellar hook protein FlgE [Photobacterium angustum]KJF96523.1 flagellar hook protein FlgE [Photobacterium angustum]KJG07421.1 flagellar hook protein FlgE [Photobacterium angustum]PSV96287.1 flagellar hook protein FlgE [Photobacterium angustum]PSW80602.1 flagellar hook protein FlgE [Photobacterium angustum]
MSMNIALSGLGAAQKDLNTTSNNIANANTFGFKESRAEFGDVYSNSIFSNAKTTTGGGVQTSTVAQQFHEGSSIYTNNPLDLRVSGSGFFAVADNKNEPANNNLTRNGAFHLNNENELVNSEGKFLLGYPVNKDSNTVASYEAKSMKIDDVFGQPTKSGTIKVSLNLPNKETTPKNSPFDFKDPDSFNKSTSSTIYDSLGKPYKMTTYYVAKYNPNAVPTNANTWEVHQTVTNNSGEERLLKPDPTKIPPAYQVIDNTNPTAPVVTGYRMRFDQNGQPYPGDAGNPTATPPIPPTPASPLNIQMETFASAGIDVGGADPTQSLTMNYDDPTQYASAFEVRKFQDVDGATTGYLSKVDIDPEGNILASYSNGKDIVVGRVALARVSNEQGLAQLGGTLWNTTQESGQAIWGDASQGSFGSVKSGTLEQSNIDMTQELVDLITAQRNFQASSRALDVNNQLQQNILQIR